MESCMCCCCRCHCHCHCHGGPPPTSWPPHKGAALWSHVCVIMEDPPSGWLTPPPLPGMAWDRDGWLGRSAFSLTKRTCFSFNEHVSCSDGFETRAASTQQSGQQEGLKLRGRYHFAICVIFILIIIVVMDWHLPPPPKHYHSTAVQLRRC